VRAPHRRLLALQLAHIAFLDEQLAPLRADITRRLTTLSGVSPPVPPAPAAGGTTEGGSPAAPVPPPSIHDVCTRGHHAGHEARRGSARWGTVGSRGGIDMAHVGTAARLAAWSGVAPGNDERTGTQRSGKTRQGTWALRTGLTQLAHAVALPKGTYVAAWYHRLAAHLGQKRAIMAVAHATNISEASSSFS
jgi:hypothetical protein